MRLASKIINKLFLIDNLPKNKDYIPFNVEQYSIEEMFKKIDLIYFE